MDLGGASWIVIDVIFVVALAGALAYAIFRWDRFKDGRRATRRNYGGGG